MRKSYCRVRPGHVVAGLVQRVVRVGDLDRAVVLRMDEEVLELQPHLELVPLCFRLREHAAQDRARAVRPFFALDRHVAREARQVGLPRHRCEAVEIRDRLRYRGRTAPGRSRLLRSLRTRRPRRRGRQGWRQARASRSGARTCRRTARRRTRCRAFPSPCGSSRASRRRFPCLLLSGFGAVYHLGPELRDGENLHPLRVRMCRNRQGRWNRAA